MLEKWTYNIIIKIYGFVDYFDKAVYWFKIIQDARILLDRVMYMIFVSILKRIGNIDEATRWCLRMSQVQYIR